VPKRPARLDLSELEALIAGHWRRAFSIPPFDFHRCEVILVLLFGAGLRVHEVQALDLAHVHVNRGSLALRRGPGEPIIVPYTPVVKPQSIGGHATGWRAPGKVRKRCSSERAGIG
jgi:integrase